MEDQAEETVGWLIRIDAVVFADNRNEANELALDIGGDVFGRDDVLSVETKVIDHE